MIKDDYLKILKEIMEKNVENKSILLTLADSIYPANGGGENWLLDINKLLKNDFFCIAICFKDVFNNTWFSKINYIEHKNVHIIQIPFVIRDIIEILNYIRPKCISHQGHNRILYCKIAKLLKIKFMTGFCFWNDLLIPKHNFFNIDMINNIYEEHPDLNIILKNSEIYLASKFMKKIIQNNIKSIEMKNDLSKINLDVIPTISYRTHFLNSRNFNQAERKYVCILNSHLLKGGQELNYLLKHLDYDIPILAVITEHDENENIIIESFKRRNEYSDINILYTSKKEKVYQVYNHCKVLLIPSIVDETFCRVAYEGMLLGIPMISYKTGNLAYLLKNYDNNTFIDMPLQKKELNTINDTIINEETLSKWKNVTESVYKDSKQKIHNMYGIMEKNVRTKLLCKINTDNGVIPVSDIEKKKLSIDDTFGFFCPFVDQGLGIQCREYIEYLKSMGIKTAIYSFKPYSAVQVDKSEWNYDNIYYSSNTREKTTLEEVIDFVFKYNVKIIMIPEICYKQIYNIVDYFKCLGVIVIGIINIEIMRYTELGYYHNFDFILANNWSSYNILKNVLPYNTVQLLEFNNYYLKKNLTIRNKELNKSTETIRIATFGGLNSYVRKNIDKTYLVFKQLEMRYRGMKKYNFKLNIYIQGIDKAVQSSLALKNTQNISIYFNNYSYTEIIGLIKENDMIIHLGDHEGLGLGFFEALNNNKPLITLDTYPNNEYVENDVNGYLVNCKFDKLTDNNEGITNRGIISVEHYYKLMEKILANTYRSELHKVIMADKNIVNNYEKNFIRLLEDI